MRSELIKLRKRKGLTQQQMAEAVKCSREYYNKIEAGTKKPSIHLAERIAEELNTSITKIYN